VALPRSRVDGAHELSAFVHGLDYLSFEAAVGGEGGEDAEASVEVVEEGGGEEGEVGGRVVGNGGGGRLVLVVVVRVGWLVVGR